MGAKSQKSKVQSAPKGMTLIEVVIGLVLVSVLVTTFAVSLVAAVYAQQNHYRNMAAALADEEIAALQTTGASQIPVQTNGSLLGVLFGQGAWSVVDDATATSASQAFRTDATVSATTVTSAMPLPANAYGDFTLSASMKIGSHPPSGWKMGFLFRAADLKNHYRLTLSANALTLEKVVNGTATTLYTEARTIADDSWQTLLVTASGSSISVKLNGLDVTTQTDATYSVGKAALAVWNGASAQFDDVSIGGTAWNFDGEAAGTIPDDWSRFGLTDLPDGAATLTTSQLYGDASFVKATVTVTWTGSGGKTKSLSQTAYVRN